MLLNWQGQIMKWQYWHLIWEMFLSLLGLEVTGRKMTVYGSATSGCLSRQNGESLSAGRTFFLRQEYDISCGVPVILSSILGVRGSEVTPINLAISHYYWQLQCSPLKYTHVLFFLKKLHTLHGCFLLKMYCFRLINTLVVPIYISEILGCGCCLRDFKVLYAIWSKVTVFLIAEKGDNKVGR